MDVLFVNARLNEITKHAGKTIPLGLAYMGAVLAKAEFDVSAIDLNVIPMDNEQITHTIEMTQPLIVAISTCTPTHLSGMNFASLTKKVNPDITVVVGGPHASVLYQEVATKTEVDIVARGEGERTMLELANCLIRHKGNLAEVKGIAYEDNGTIKVTDKRPPISDPDELPFPARDLFPFNLYAMPNAVLASRGGCPFACYFCAVNNIWEGRRRFRKPENVVREFLSVIDTHDIPKANAVNFSDDALTLDRNYVMSLCRFIKPVTEYHPLRWRCNTRVDLVDAQLLREMRQAGCYSIEYGIEAGSQEIIDSIGKRISLDQIKRAVDLTINFGIDAECSFMFPHPEDTEETIRAQIRFMQELHQMGASETLSLTTPLPGTDLYNNAEKLGVKILSRNWDEYDCRHLIIATKYLSHQKLQAMYREMIQEIGMRPS